MTAEQIWKHLEPDILNKHFTERDQLLLKMGFIMAVAGVLCDLTDAVPRDKAPPELAEWVRTLLGSIHPGQLVDLHTKVVLLDFDCD